jgi:hypothetical protein
LSREQSTWKEFHQINGYALASWQCCDAIGRLPTKGPDVLVAVRNGENIPRSAAYPLSGSAITFHDDGTFRKSIIVDFGKAA